MWTTIDLLTTSTTQNENGFNVQSTTFKRVFAEKNSIRSNEFYSSSIAGMKVDLMFQVRLIDYSEEKLFDYNSKRYEIIRTYAKDDEWIELYGRVLTWV